MKRPGFSLIEVLVVIVVISVLVSLTIFMISSWRSDAAEAEVKNDLINAANALEQSKNFSSGYPANQAALASIYHNTENVDLTYTRRVNGSYCLNAQSSVISTIQWNIDSNVGRTPQSGTCSP